MEVTLYGGAGDQNSSPTEVLGILRVFRVVRIFRIVIILNKIKRSRENAQILRKRAKYKRQGSPVERVIEILQRLRSKSVGFSSSRIEPSRQLGGRRRSYL